MTRRIASGASHSGQPDSSVAEGGWVGSVVVSLMGCGPFSKQVRAFSSEVETGSHQENASTLGRGSLLLRHLVRHVSLEPQPLDLILRIRDGVVGIMPCEADFERGKRNPVDDEGLHIRPLDPGVPQTRSSLERFDLKAIMVHFRGSRCFPAAMEPRAGEEDCELVHIFGLIFGDPAP
jgi:hypothetical protein